MSLEGTIRDLGLQEIGQLLSLGRKSGLLAVTSALRGARAWLRFVDGALVDAGEDDAPPEGEATPAAVAGDRAAVEETVLEVLEWREGSFAFTPATQRGSGASCVRIPTDAMLVESARREDLWGRLRDRVPSARAVPAFVDVEPKALPLLHLVPAEWEVLTRVDGDRDLRTLAALLRRDVVEVAAIVHGLVGTGLLTVRDGSAPFGAVASEAVAHAASRTSPVPPPFALSAPSPTTSAGALLADEPAGLPEPDDDLWIPTPSELAGLGGDETAARDPRPSARDPFADDPFAGVHGPVVTWPAPGHVASHPLGPSSHDGRPHDVTGEADLASSGAHGWREAGDAAARRGDFETALDCWSRHLRAHERAPDADRVREAIGLVARLHALLHPAEPIRVPVG